MMTKTTKTALWLALFSCAGFPSVFSQIQLTGAVTNAAGQGLPAASVLLLSSTDSTLIKGQLSALDGNFTIDGVAPGTYRLGLSMLGYQDYFSVVFSLDNQTRKKDLGATVLMEKTQALNEVSVVAKRPLFEQKIDRLVVNVGASITSAGSNALEVLQRSPGVMVNRGVNAISMSGKNGVVVMINGKISRLPPSAIIQLLEGMNADNIERIELIQTPPASFDAEGNAGIINIILKKNADEGFNGGYSAYAGYGLKEKLGANLNFNYRRNKANLYGDYSWTYDNNPQVFSNYRSFLKDGNLMETDGRSDRDPTRTHTQNGRLGLDFQLNSKTVLGGLVGWMDRYWTMDALNKVVMKTNGVPTGFINIPNNEINHWRHYLGNLNLEHHFTKNQTINLDVDYAYYHFTNPSNYINRYLDSNGALTREDQVRVNKSTPMSIFAGKADFTQKFGENMTLETGLKTTMTRFDNNVLVEDLLQPSTEWVRNPDYSANYGMEEDIAAVYSAFTTKLTVKTDLKAGLRYEYTHSNLGSPEQPNILDRKYGKLFPSLFLSHKINEFNTLQFSYSRRINRPDFNQLAPYFIFYDPTTVETGNPKLQPSVTDGVKADYLWKSVQLSLQYNFENEAILQGQPDVDTIRNQQLTGAVNFDYAKYANASLSIPLHPTKWWDIQLNLNGQWVEYKDKNQDPLSSQLSWFGFGSQTFRLPKQFSVELSGWYFSGGPFGKVETHPMGELNFGIGKELGGNRGNLRFNISDILFTSIYTGSIDDSVDNIHYRGTYQQTERVFRLSYSNKFGNNKLKASRQRATGSEEERRRVN